MKAETLTLWSPESTLSSNSKINPAVCTTRRSVAFGPGYIWRHAWASKNEQHSVTPYSTKLHQLRPRSRREASLPFDGMTGLGQIGRLGGPWPDLASVGWGAMADLANGIQLAS